MTRAETLFPDNPDELKTVAEVALALGRPQPVITHYIRTGALPATKTKNRWLIRAGDIIHVAFRPRWEVTRRPRTTTTGAVLYPTTLPDNEP
jgi:helix-turn-helix protein